MLQALLAGVASVKAQQTRMSVIGTNLANINTTGYKGSDVDFQDMISETVQGASAPTSNLGGTNAIQYGLGVTVGSTSTDTQQGSLSATNRPSDLAIQGNGFFAVSSGSTVSYTRDGGFDLDSNGDLVQRSTGERLLGYPADATGTINTNQPLTSASNLNIPIGSLTNVQATHNVTLSGNLNSAALSTDTWSTQSRIYDSQGGAHDITIQFTNHQSPATGTPPSGATSSWDWSVYNGTSATGTPLTSSTSSGNSPLYFDQNGAIKGTADFNVTVPASGSSGAAATAITLKMDSVSQISNTSQVTASGQDGFPPGSLDSYSIGKYGVITGTFTNGLTRALGQVAIAQFSNPSGLEKEGSNLWKNTTNSGVAVVGTPGTGGRGSISAGYLEQSNVDISTQFSNLIVAQRSFQANTKIITTVDEMLQDLINIKH